jgi:hypothetical protein
MASFSNEEPLKEVACNETVAGLKQKTLLTTNLRAEIWEKSAEKLGFRVGEDKEEKKIW